jgi:hypothetical protein
LRRFSRRHQDGCYRDHLEQDGRVERRIVAVERDFDSGEGWPGLRYGHATWY